MNEKEMSVFPQGGPNDAFAQYFTGQSYLHMLSTEQVSIGNVTFEPNVATTGISIVLQAAADKCCSLLPAADGIVNGESPQERCSPAMLSIFLPG